MDAETSRPGRVAVAARWAGRILSLGSIGLIGLFVVAEPPWPWRITPFEGLMLLCFPVAVVAGMALAWRREGAGGLLAALGAAAFYLVHRVGAGGWPRGPWFLLFASPSAFFLLSWALRRGAGRAPSRRAPPPPPSA